MRQLQAKRHGQPTDVLHLADVADAPLGETEVRIASHAVGLNFLDLMRCRGDYPLPPAFPLTFGVEVAGRVIEAGADTDVATGTDVIACPTLPRGALGDHVVVDAAYVVERPADLGAIVGAALPVTYQTAWFALRRADVGAGTTVLVTAGAGGVGIATTQLAVALGARVIAAAGGAAKAAVCAEHGAAVTVDYLAEDLTAATLGATDGNGVDVVVEQVGGSVFARSLDALAFEGTLVAIGTAGGSSSTVEPMDLAARNVSVLGLSWGSTYPMRAPAAVAAAYRELFELYRRGAVRPLVSRVVGLDETAAALAALGDRRTVGKLVVEVDGGRG
jgi:NADPH2:quinone reductase